MAYLKMNHRDSAPHTPRLILLGPTGCGKSVQAELLASKYGLVNGKLTQKVYEQTYLIYGPFVHTPLFALKIVVPRLSIFKLPCKTPFGCEIGLASARQFSVF